MNYFDSAKNKALWEKELSSLRGERDRRKIEGYKPQREKAAEKEAEKKRLEKERALQEATLSIKKRFGKNAILKGLNYEPGATAIERNGQIGGHKA